MKIYVILNNIMTWDDHRVEVLGAFVDKQKGINFRNKSRKTHKGKILFYETELEQ